MSSVFDTVNYWSFQIPNYEEILEFSSTKTDEDVDNQKFDWGKHCDIDRIPVTGVEFQHLLQPSINLFSESFGKTFKYTLYNPWINVYKRGFFQEVHTHEPHDVSCVLFLNTGKNFSDFYFFNRYDVTYSSLWKSILNVKNKHYPKIEDGTIIFFPGNTLHGVSKHNSDIERRTIACNLDLTIV